MDMTGFCLIHTTTDDEAEAEKIAAALVGEKLASCVQVGAVASHYVWRGKTERSREFLLAIKARRADFDRIAARIRALHHYELPEIVALPILAADPAYLDWMERATE